MRMGRPVVAMIAAAIVLFGVALADLAEGSIEYTSVASTFGLILSALGLYLSRRPALAAVPWTQQREYAAEKLAESVRVQWTSEAKVLGLADPDPMPVRWAFTKHDVSDHLQLIFDVRPGLEGRSDRINELAERFLALRRRRLVILGGPGTGKTTLAVQIVLRLLQVREPADPIPVVLTASSWNSTVHPQMQDWLAFHLFENYPALRAINKAMPSDLVNTGMVLPVIDGLDEVDTAHRSALLTALNDSLGATDPLILTSRTGEYIDAVDNADVLTAAAVIEAQPLTAGAAADYLDNCLPPRQRATWGPLLEQLRRNDDTPVAEICTTPLGLWLLRTVHIEHKSDPNALLDPTRYPDAGAIKAHLFDELIPATMSKRRPVHDGSDPLRPRRDWDGDDTRPAGAGMSPGN